MLRWVPFLMVASFLAGCGMPDQEVRDKAGDAAIAVKRVAESAGDAAKKAYDEAAAKGQVAVKDAGAKLSDAALKGKVLAGFELVSGLNAKEVEVNVNDGVVSLSGTVLTDLDKMKVEGVAYGVTGDRSKVVSKVVVLK